MYIEKAKLPYNSCGIIHNYALEEISTLRNFPGFSVEESYYVGVKTAEKLLFLRCDIKFPDFTEVAPYFNLINGDGDDFKRILDSLLHNGLLPRLLLEEMMFFYNELRKVNDEKEFYKHILNFIEHFKQNSKLSEDELIICWIITSISVFSFEYWKNIANNPYSNWFNIFNFKINKSNQIKGKFWKIIGTIAADCAGALVGAIVGSLINPAIAPASASAAGSGASSAFVKTFIENK